MKRTQDQVDLIYNHTHKDYRDTNQCRVKCVLYYNRETGATSCMGIVDLPDYAFNQKLESAIKKQELK